jgi:hypothetical protein
VHRHDNVGPECAAVLGDPGRGGHVELAAYQACDEINACVTPRLLKGR